MAQSVASTPIEWKHTALVQETVYSVTVDARLAYASGIGTYIRKLLPEVVRATSRAEVSFQILYDPAHSTLREEMDLGWCEWTPCAALPFSLAEHLAVSAAIAPKASLLWVPHFNIPLAYMGRLLVTIHDVLPLALPRFVSGVHKRVMARILFRMIAQRARAILCDSHFTADELQRLLGVADRQLHVTHLGVDRRWFSIPVGRPPRERPYFLCVGNVKPHKNLPALVEAFQRVAESVPHDLVVVGRKEGFNTGDESVERLAQRLGTRIAFTGHVPQSELEQFFGHATALVFPSLYEGFGLPAVEAMAAGCPVLAARTAALPEVCGDAALYCDPESVEDMAQKIVMLASDDRLRQTLAARGRQRAQAFSWERCAESTTRVLMDVLSRTAQPSGHRRAASLNDGGPK